MIQNHYPWNTQALVDWLRDEFNSCAKQDVESKLQIPRQVLRSWLTEPSPPITLAQIRLIAQYRGWNLDQIIAWLGLQPAHVQELIDQDTSSVG